MKKHRVALYTALILDSNGCSRVVPVLVIARPLHTARVHRNVSAVDDSVAAARGSYASRLPSSGGVTLYFGIPKRPLLVNSLFFSSHLILTICRLIPQEFQAIVHIYLNFYLYRHNRRNSTHLFYFHVLYNFARCENSVQLCIFKCHIESKLHGYMTVAPFFYGMFHKLE